MKNQDKTSKITSIDAKEDPEYSAKINEAIEVLARNGGNLGKIKGGYGSVVKEGTPEALEKEKKGLILPLQPRNFEGKTYLVCRS